jgi:hypothetical protein
MESFRLELNYQKETGFGLLFGCFQKGMFMELGLLLEK